MRKSIRLFTLLLGAALLTSCNGGHLPYDSDAIDTSIDTPYVDYYAPVSKITFAEDDKDITLNKGETYQYSFTMEPKRAQADGVSLSSSNEEVATINNGVLSAVGGGKAAITVSSPDDLFSSVNLNVEVIVPLTDFSLGDPVRMGYEKTYQLAPTLNPTDSTQNEFEYVSSNSEVATVSGSGLITSKLIDGECDITVKSLALGTTKTLHVQVIEPHITSISVEGNATRVEVDHEIELKAAPVPEDAYEQEIRCPRISAGIKVSF